MLLNYLLFSSLILSWYHLISVRPQRPLLTRLDSADPMACLAVIHVGKGGTTGPVQGTRDHSRISDVPESARLPIVMQGCLHTPPSLPG
jgi:hypothetical protein